MSHDFVVSGNMNLTVTKDGHWKTAKGKDPIFSVCCEVARSGRARCRKCSDMIAKGSTRVGVPIRDPRGEFGYISAWQHLTCSRIEGHECLPMRIFGFESLTAEQQSIVLDEVTRLDAPAHFEALQPDDLVKRGKLPEAETPPTLLQNLLPFQREGIWWMVQREQSEDSGTRCGILADEMGMGMLLV